MIKRLIIRIWLLIITFALVACYDNVPLTMDVDKVIEAGTVFAKEQSGPGLVCYKIRAPSYTYYIWSSNIKIDVGDSIKIEKQ